MGFHRNARDGTEEVQPSSSYAQAPDNNQQGVSSSRPCLVWECLHHYEGILLINGSGA